MDTTLYTDGHGIKVTASEFVTGKTSYRMDGIINARINLIKAGMAPAILLILLGIAAVTTGLMHLYSNVAMDSFYVGNNLITANRLAIIAGTIMLVFGAAWGAKLRDRYAVHIVTAEGHKEPVISTRKDYVHQIVSALQKALSLNRNVLRRTE